MRKNKIRNYQYLNSNIEIHKLNTITEPGFYTSSFKF